MKLYLSGPMTGIEKLNFPHFENCSNALRILGHKVVSPHEIEDAGTWDSCLKADLTQMLGCDAIVVLDGWEASRGARLEVTTAINVGMEFYRYADVVNMGEV